MKVDIICSVLDGERFLPEFLDSIRAQTHEDWRLWLRDDGSADKTVAILRAAEADPRIRLIHVGGPRLGVAGAFGWLLERVPADADYVMCADADDVWLSHKIAHTLTRMLETERVEAPKTPILVHTDLVVVDEHLDVTHRSFWSFADIRPEPVSLRRLVVRNVATAPTVMMNRALRESVGSTPAAAAFQDWWYALVAAAFGRVVAVPEATVLYRQHGGNAVGARPAAGATWRAIPSAVLRRLNTASLFRRGLEVSARQAAAFLDRYGDRLTETDRRFLREYSRIPHQPLVRRKLDLLRLRRLPEHGFWQTLGIVFRG